VDLGSAAELGDPVGGLDRLIAATSSDFPHLLAARSRTERRVVEVATALSARDPVVGISTCVFGSWARAELTDDSDDDWAVLVDRPFAAYERDVLAEILAAQDVLGGGPRKPGAQGVFGGPIAVPELIDHIGLDADTNTNLTRRMLLLLESRDLHGSARSNAVSSILERYLNASVKDEQPPRFLLNGATSARLRTCAGSWPGGLTRRRSIAFAPRSCTLALRIQACAQLEPTTDGSA